jgi:hypothetical protein
VTERKPAHTTFESWVEKQIREAQDRGEFDNLPGAGKPIPDLHTDDETWWLKRKLRAEGVSPEAALPTPLRLLKEIDRLPELVRTLNSEAAVRTLAEDLNRRILDWLLVPTGPQVLITPVDIEAVITHWRTTRT